MFSEGGMRPFGRRGDFGAPEHTRLESTPAKKQQPAEEKVELPGRATRFFQASFSLFKKNQEVRDRYAREHPYEYEKNSALPEAEIRAELPRIQTLLESDESSVAESFFQQLTEWIELQRQGANGVVEEVVERYFWAVSRVLQLHERIERLPADRALIRVAPFLDTPGMANAFASSLPIIATKLAGDPGSIQRAFTQVTDGVERVRLAAAVADIRESLLQQKRRENRVAYAEKTSALAAQIDQLKQMPGYSPILFTIIDAQVEVSFNQSAAQEAQRAIWSTIDTSDAPLETRSVGIIARDAIGCFDSNASLMSIGRVETSLLSQRQTPSSYDIRTIMTYPSRYGADPLRAEDREEILELYEEAVRPYLPEAQQSAFEKAWQDSATWSQQIPALCAGWLEQFQYQQVDLVSVDRGIVKSSEERGVLPREELQTLFHQLHRPSVRKVLEEDLGILLKDLSLREQKQLLLLMASSDVRTYGRFTSAIKRYGISAAITLLACENRPETATDFLEICEQATAETAKLIVERCADYLKHAQKTSANLSKELFQNDKTALDQPVIEEILFARATKSLQEIARATNNGETRDTLLTSINRAEPDMVLLAAVVRSVLKGRNAVLPIESLKGLSLTSTAVGAWSETEREQKRQDYLNVLRTNWVEKGEGPMNEALHGLEHGLSQPNTQFFELSLQGKLVAFVRFDELPGAIQTGALYAGSFNVLPELRDSALGNLFFRETLSLVGKERPIEAHVLATDTLASVYIERFGFSIIGVEHELGPSGEDVPWFRIKRAPAGEKAALNTLPPDYSGAQKNSDTLISWVEQQTRVGRSIDSYKVDKSAAQVQLRLSA